MKTEVRNAVAEAYYTLCPNDPRTKLYFELCPEDQARVMHDILRKITSWIGGGSIKRGAELLARWQKLKIELPVIQGHPFLTEGIAQKFLIERARDVAKTRDSKSVTASTDQAPCPNCVPMPPLHLSTRSAELLELGKKATVSSKVPKLGAVTATILLRVEVLTPFDPTKSMTMSMGDGEMSHMDMLQPADRRPKARAPKRSPRAMATRNSRAR